MIIFIPYIYVFLEITCLVFTILQSSIGLKWVEFLLLFLLLLRSPAAVELWWYCIYYGCW